MNLPIAINKLSSQLGLTSRTLRHWESEGLFQSMRDLESGWRVYDEEAVLCIKITALLRKLHIPLKDIKTILEVRTLNIVETIIRKQIYLLERDREEITIQKNMLNNIISYLTSNREYQSGNSLTELNYFFHTLLGDEYEKKEDFVMVNNQVSNSNIRFITLPSMRTVYNISVGISPEDEAMGPVLEWLKSANLMGTARLFGGNVKPFPGGGNSEYGYGVCASISEGIEIPGHLKEMRLPGGLYAMMPSSEDIYGSWQILMKYLSESNEYISDRSRLCLEEHIRNENPEGSGNQFMLNLLEPVKKR